MDWTLAQEILLPELFVLLGIVLTLILSLHPKTKSQVPLVAILSLSASSLTLIQYLPKILTRSSFGLGSTSILADSFMSDTLSVFFRLLIYFVTFLIALASVKYLKVLESPGEYYTILLTAALGAGFLVGANDFLVFFIALETLGLGSVLLASYARLNRNSNEAGIKYLLSSAAASGILLLGISLVYGLTGATNFYDVGARLSEFSAMGLISFPVQALMLTSLVAAISFKLAAAPFHNWSPDVYTGAPTTTTLFLSVVSKTAAFGFAIRLFASVVHSQDIGILLASVSVLSIIIGNYVGVVQVISRGSIKRLLAYSSIAQAGYLLIGLVVFERESVSALVFYLTVYAFMNTGAFLSAIYFEQETGSDNIYDMAGLIQRRPVIAIALALSFINLAGLPFIPAGFIAKFFLFSTAYSSSLPFGQFLAIVGLLGSLISVFYYLYVIKIVVVDSSSNAIKTITPAETSNMSPIRISLAISILLMIWVGVFGTGFVKDLAVQIVNGVGS